MKKLTLSLIVAMTNENVIGREGGMPWQLPADLKYFMKTTSGHSIIMGRKTFESIGSKPLPNRTNIIVTSDKSYNAENCIVVNSFEEAYNMKNSGIIDEEVFVIGGGKIYAEAIKYADKLYITHIDASIIGDTYFPKISNRWNKISEDFRKSDENNSLDMCFVVYEK